MGILNLLFGALFKPQKQSLSRPFDEEAYNKQNQAEINRIKTKYDMDTLEGISKIPIPTKKETLENLPNVTVKIEYILQRKATEHKKNNRFDLAIACLRKSNQLMPFSCVSYPKKDYERLVELLKQDNQFDIAHKEQAAVDVLFAAEYKTNHYRAFENAKQMGNDLVQVTWHLGCCAECAKYRNRVYTISGHNSKYTKFPQFLIDNPGHCMLAICSFYEGVNSLKNYNGKSVNAVKYSNRPFVDDRTQNEKQQYDEKLQKSREEQIDRRNYDYLREHLPDLAPKSYGGYVRMKNSNSVNYQKIFSAAQKNGVDLNK